MINDMLIQAVTQDWKPWAISYSRHHSDPSCGIFADLDANHSQVRRIKHCVATGCDRFGCGVGLCASVCVIVCACVWIWMCVCVCACVGVGGCAWAGADIFFRGDSNLSTGCSFQAENFWSVLCHCQVDTHQRIYNLSFDIMFSVIFLSKSGILQLSSPLACLLAWSFLHCAQHYFWCRCAS